MKKTIAVILALCLSVALLCACAPGAYVSGGNASDGNASAGNASAGDAIATEGNATPETEGNEPAATGTVPASLSALLTEAWENYYPGTAGCSLTAAKYAAQIMDWFVAANADPDAALTEAKTLGQPGTDEYGVTYADKLTDLYTAAISLYGYYGEELLETAGYVPAFMPYNMVDVNAVFTTLYAAAGAEAPTYIRVFRSDENAERFISSAMEVEAVTAENVVKALVDAGVLAEKVKLVNMTVADGHMKLDLSADFGTQVQSQGTTGEYMLLGGVVNTFLSAFDAQDVMITVDGKTLESGHNIYDMAMAFYTDNVAVG